MLLVALAAAAAAIAPDFEFKGARPGDSLAELRASKTILACDPWKRQPGTQRCWFRDTSLAGRSQVIYAYINDARGFVGIETTISTDRFDEVAKALTAKYGEPVEAAVREVQNRAGATFSSRAMRWRFASGDLVFRERANTVDTAQLLWTDRAWEQELSAKPAVVDF